MLKLNTKNNRRDARLSKAIRRAAGCQGKPYPIVDRDGFSVPSVIQYKCFSKKIVIVGRGWICENGLV